MKHFTIKTTLEKFKLNSMDINHSMTDILKYYRETYTMRFALSQIW